VPEYQKHFDMIRTDKDFKKVHEMIGKVETNPNDNAKKETENKVIKII
jgi:hypothetical protein